MVRKRNRTWEIYVREGNRWLVNSVLHTEGAARRKAEQLAESGAFEAVKITETWQDNAGNDREKDIFKREGTKTGSQDTTITQVEEAPHCGHWQELYQFPARLSLGKVMRQYLDGSGMTALEALFDMNTLRLVTRNDNLFPRLVSVIASVQSRREGVELSERSDFLYTSANFLIERAREYDSGEANLAYLKQHGFDQLWRDLPDFERDLHLKELAAAYIGQEADWPAKTEMALELGQLSEKTELKILVEEILSEICDGADACRQILGYQQDLGSAVGALTDVVTGRYQGKPDTVLAKLSDYSARTGAPLLREVLIARIKRMITGLNPLTKDGNDADMKSFAMLVRKMEDDFGLIGGVDMAEAMALRARQLMERKHPDRSVASEAVTSITRLMELTGARIGYLLDICSTETGKPHQGNLVVTLAKEMKDIGNPAKLVRDGDIAKGAAVLAELKRKVDKTDLPKGWGERFSDKLHQMAEVYESGDVEITVKPKGKPMTVSLRDLKRIKIKAGTVLFKEGEAGDAAYLVNAGRLEVLKRIGGQDKRIAKVGRGAIVGEMALIDDQPRMASVRTLEECVLTVIPYDDFQARLNRLEQTDKVLRRLLDVFVDRIRVQTRKALEADKSMRF